MKRHHIQFLKIFSGIILLVTVVISGSGSAAITTQATSGDDNNSRKNISRSSIDTLSGDQEIFWTKELMLSAEPYPFEIPNELPEFSLIPSISNGNQKIIPSSPPKIFNQDLSIIAETLDLSSSNTNGYEYPPPFVRYQNFDIEQEVPIPNDNYSYYPFPYSTVGYLYFLQDGYPFRCSAASIGNNAIWTAGHCIHKGDGDLDSEGNIVDQGTWSTNVLFIPGYQPEDFPNYDYGSWEAVNLWISPEWFDYADLRYDMGGAILQKWDNQKISEVVGNLGFAYNLNGSQHWMNIGYPSAAPFDGSSQQICAGSFAYEDSGMDDPSTDLDPVPVAMGCDMTQGSSGGPWILNISGNLGQTNLLNGNNSYRYTFHPKELFSPYFGNAAFSLYDDLITSTSTNK